MKSILQFLGSVLFLRGAAFAKAAKEVGEQESAIKPLKVSEINANLFSAIYDFFGGIQKSILEGVVSLKDFVETGEWLILEFKQPETRHLMEAFCIRLSIALILSLIIARLVAVWIKPKINGLLLNQPTPQKFKRLMQAVLLSTVTPLVFGFFLYTIFRTITPSGGIYLETVRILSSGSVTIWILLNICRVFLKPVTLDHQHIPLPIGTLQSMYKWIRRMGVVALLGFFLLEMGRLVHLPEAGEKLLLQASTFIFLILTILMIFSFRKDLKLWISEQQKSIERSRLKKALLPYLDYGTIPFLVLIGMSYVSWVSRDYGRFQEITWKVLGTLSLFPLFSCFTHCLKKLRILYLHERLKRCSPAFAERSLFYGKQVDFVFRVLTIIILFAVALYIWGFNLYNFISSKMGILVFEKVFSIITIITFALVITRAGMGLLNTYLSAAQEAQSEALKQKMARFKTIHSVSRNVLRIAVWTPALLLIVVEMDINILPILAPMTLLGAGLAIGMQSLVKDFVTGFFMLLEDAFVVDDLVTINGQMGRIESLTVRVVRLRATDGSLYTFPYGSITNLCNQNRDFSAAVMLFQIGIDADMMQVYEILEKISKDLRKDPKTRSLVTGNIEINGIHEISDSALQIRAIVKTKPGQHFKVRWAFNFLLKQYLESYHIPGAIPRQISYSYPIEK